MQLLLSLKYDNFDVSAISMFQPTKTSQSKSPGNEVAADFALTDMYTVLSWVYKPTVKKLNIRRFSIPKLMTPSFEQPQPKLHYKVEYKIQTRIHGTPVPTLPPTFPRRNAKNRQRGAWWPASRTRGSFPETLHYSTKRPSQFCYYGNKLGPRVKCLAQKHNTMSPARARTRTARSGVDCTNHKATAAPLWWLEYCQNWTGF